MSTSLETWSIMEFPKACLVTQEFFYLLLITELLFVIRHVTKKFLFLNSVLECHELGHSGPDVHFSHICKEVTIPITLPSFIIIPCELCGSMDFILMGEE